MKKIFRSIYDTFINPFERSREVSKIIYGYFTELDEDNYFIDYHKLFALQIADILVRNEDGILVIKIILGRPGLLIGKGGQTINALQSQISIELFGIDDKVKFDIVEHDLWMFNKYIK